jgi:hypothetical protein
MNRRPLHPSAAGWKRWLTTRRLCAALLAATCVLALGHSAAAAPRQPHDPPCTTFWTIFVHTAAAANSLGDWTDLDNPVTNGCPQMLVEVTATFTPGAVYDTHALGVWYDGRTAKWSIFHEDHTPVPLGATYTIFATLPQPAFFIQTATSANSAGDYTVIDNPQTNNQPYYELFVTPNWSVNSVYDTHVLGVWYNGSNWTIFHEDHTPIPVGTSYNVHARSSDDSFFHIATNFNSSGDWTEMNDPVINNNPNEYVFVTANFSGVYDTHVLGVWYGFDGHWTIFHEDSTAIPAGATYNVFSL